MKWRTKRWLYQYNSRLGEIGPTVIIPVCFHLFFLIGGVGTLFLILIAVIKGEVPISISNYAMGLFILNVSLLIIGVVFPYRLELIAKHHSFKKIPVLKKLNTIKKFLENSHFILREQDLEKIEGSFLEEHNYPITEKTVKHYEIEIEHICEIIKNKKQVELAMVEHAALRAKQIAKEIAESIERDEYAHIHAIKTREAEIAREWTEVYLKD
ncbi:hypothetical protein [Lysinibacillus sphaericus]|uniref:hypothetical protein n=1 Tax=Lysinibacillus sphaericus TaxID=1421 RepID=UPI001A9E4F7C|nr:hypothetical protein [Lysinibacillus sphaericus]QTB28854.1 hypothetical protein J2D51_09740 [Lysinibacillus sphaericus]